MNARPVYSIQMLMNSGFKEVDAHGHPEIAIDNARFLERENMKIRTKRGRRGRGRKVVEGLRDMRVINPSGQIIYRTQTPDVI